MTIPPYTLIENDHSNTGIILTSPHSGRSYPQDILKWVSVDVEILRKLEDPYVDILLQDASGLAVTSIYAPFARCCVDLNRAPNELDPKLIRFIGQFPANTSRVRQGLGVIPRVAGANEPLYRGLIPWEEAKRRLTRYYKPFHAILAHTIEGTLSKCDQVILLDWHSMPSTPPEGHFGLADIVLGNVHGKSCAPALTLYLEDSFRKHGLSVARNTPYAGGYITHHYGQPDNNIHAIQIEINRGLYLDETTFEILPKALDLQSIIADVVKGITQHPILFNSQLAAE